VSISKFIVCNPGVYRALVDSVIDGDVQLVEGYVGRVENIKIHSRMLSPFPVVHFDEPHYKRHTYDAPGRARRKKGKR
jgi:hypothetical protein